MKLSVLAWIERFCLPILALAAVGACLSFYGSIPAGAYRPLYILIVALALVVAATAHWRPERDLGPKPVSVQSCTLGFLVLGPAAFPIWVNGIMLLILTAYACWSAVEWWRPRSAPQN